MTASHYFIKTSADGAEWWICGHCQEPLEIAGISSCPRAPDAQVEAVAVDALKTAT